MIIPEGEPMVATEALIPKETCHHPYLHPTAWNQPEPEPCEMIVCECGQNATCPVCGFGHGAYPCKCSRNETPTIRYIPQWQHDELLAINLKEYSAIWEAMS